MVLDAKQAISSISITSVYSKVGGIDGVFASLPVREQQSPAPADPLPQPSSPVHTESESAAVSSDLSATATANECVSEGQWVINMLSEGEVADTEANECE